MRVHKAAHGCRLERLLERSPLRAAFEVGDLQLALDALPKQGVHQRPRADKVVPHDSVMSSRRRAAIPPTCEQSCRSLSK
eukprot:scaffold156539_cov26-Tisochrysis_lutea.AAC.3